MLIVCDWVFQDRSAGVQRFAVRRHANSVEISACREAKKAEGENDHGEHGHGRNVTPLIMGRYNDISLEEVCW